MTPSVPELLTGTMIALNRPQPAEAGPEYVASRMGMIGMISAMAAGEANRAVAAACAENADIRALFAKAQAHDAALEGRLARAAAETDDDLTLSAVDQANAGLRRLLIALHTMVEAAGDTALDHDILRLYRRMAAGRRLTMPGGR